MMHFMRFVAPALIASTSLTQGVMHMFKQPVEIPSSLRGASLAASLWLGVVASSDVRISAAHS